jgi:HTH-type transcriptional regulator, sugar sensing transcriptional regulator
MLEKFLEDIGLSDKEAATYIALLAFAEASVIDISAKTKIKRTTVYVILDALKQKGLVSEIEIGKKTLYRAEPPERLETYLERRKLQLDDHSRRLKDVIPQLKSLERGSGERPIVKYYEGRSGLQSMIDDFYLGPEKGGEAFLVYSRDLLEEAFPASEREKYKNIRQEKGISLKVIYSSSKGDAPVAADSMRIRIDGEKHPLTCDIAIYGDKVRMTVLGKPLSGVSIKSKDIARSLQTLFELAFEGMSKKTDGN